MSYNLQQQAMTSSAKSSDPLGDLNTMLKGDMDATNALIIDRLQSSIEVIPKIAGHLIEAGGKRIRPLLTLACTKVFDGDMTKAHMLATTVEYIHSATLLHDDVVDESLERRGKASANQMFGNKPSILVGDFLFARGFELMVETGNMRVLDILSKTSRFITEGEIRQIDIERNLKTTEDDYFAVIESKTAALFAAACEVGPVIAGVEDDIVNNMREYGHNIGMAFQIVDDILDYTAQEDRLGKKVGDDFREGKFTLPIIYALEQADEKELLFWQTTMIEQDVADGDLTTAQMLIEKTGAVGRCVELANKYVEKAKLCLIDLPPSIIRQKLSDVADYIVVRAN